MYLFYIPQCTMWNRNVHISILNGVLWDMKLVHRGICEIALLVWLVSSYLSCNVNSVMHLEKNTWIKLFMQNGFRVVLKFFTFISFSRGHDTQFWHLMCHCHLGPLRTCTKSSTNTPRLIYWKHLYFFFRLLNCWMFQMHHPIYASMSTVASEFCVVLKKKKGHRSICILRCDTTELIVHS